MRVKLLIFPLVILVATVVSIWVIKPLLVDTLAQNKNLDTKEKLLAKERARGVNMEKLLSDLNARASDKKVVEDFIPSSKDEEKIVHYLSFLAAGSELWLLDIKMEDPSEKSKAGKQTRITGAEVAEVAPAAVGTTAPAEEIAITDLSEKFKLSNLDVSVKISGKYEKMKEFLAKLITSNRFNGIKSAEIAVIENTAAAGDEETKTNPTELFLEGNFVFDFSYLSQVKEATGVPATFVEAGQYNAGSLAKIQSVLQTPVSELTGETPGKTNPFVRQ